MPDKIGGAIGCAKMRTFECLACGDYFDRLVKDDELPSCPVCLSDQVERRFGKPAVHFFHAGWQEHIAADPIYCGSMAQLREECEKHDVTSGYERDTVTHYDRGRKRWI